MPTIDEQGLEQGGNSSSELYKIYQIIGIQLSIDFEKFGAVFKNTLFDVIYDIWINFRLSTLGCIFNTYFQSNCAFHYVSLYFKCLVL